MSWGGLHSSTLWLERTATTTALISSLESKRSLSTLFAGIESVGTLHPRSFTLNTPRSDYTPAALWQWRADQWLLFGVRSFIHNWPHKHTLLTDHQLVSTELSWSLPLQSLIKSYATWSVLYFWGWGGEVVVVGELVGGGGVVSLCFHKSAKISKGKKPSIKCCVLLLAELFSLRPGVSYQRKPCLTNNTASNKTRNVFINRTICTSSTTTAVGQRQSLVHKWDCIDKQSPCYTDTKGDSESAGTKYSKKNTFTVHNINWQRSDE